MKKILVPTDFSNMADNALNVAVQLARKHHAEIYLLHTLDLPLAQIDAMSSQSELPEALFFMKLANKRFDNVLKRDHLRDISVHQVVEFDETLSGILESCKKNNIDLIVMGSHGVSGLKEMFIGSTTEKVVRSSKIPVLVIKKEHEDFEINEFVFASDFSKESEQTYKQAIELAETLEAKLHLVMINTPNRFMTTGEANKRIGKFLASSDFDNYVVHIYNDETIEEGILNFSESVSADLIGISTHGRQGIAHFLNGSISEDLVNHAGRPVITFKI